MKHKPFRFLLLLAVLGGIAAVAALASYSPNGRELISLKYLEDTVLSQAVSAGEAILEEQEQAALEQAQLDLEAVKILKANGCEIIAEGANMPTTREATDYILENSILFMPGKAANAGGVATSALEMSQNSMRYSWTAEEVDAKLKGIMKDIYAKVSDAAARYGLEGNYVAGANIAGFEKVVDAMMAQGIV